jgi:hypothetical protein
MTFIIDFRIRQELNYKSVSVSCKEEVSFIGRKGQAETEQNVDLLSQSNFPGRVKKEGTSPSLLC